MKLFDTFPPARAVSADNSPLSALSERSIAGHEIDNHGLGLLFLALRRRCECETGDAHPECEADPLDRWWGRVLAGMEDPA